MSELDEQLRRLAISAQQYPPLSQERQVALRQLINGILLSGKLCHPRRGQFSGCYEEIYDEAVQDLMLYVCRSIDKYEPERATVMAWVNVLLDRRFFQEAIPKVLGQSSVRHVTLDSIYELASANEPPALTELLRECLETDPAGLFKGECLEDYPTASFQVVALRRLAGMSWQEISAEFGVKVGTVSSFYSRCLVKFSQQMRTYCQTS